jgi:hypothetical protein
MLPDTAPLQFPTTFATAPCAIRGTDHYECCVRQDPKNGVVVFATVHAARRQLTGLTAGLWRPSTRSCFALAYDLFGLSSDYFRVVANLWAASFQGIQLGYEGFAPDDADSSSIRFPVQEELEIQIMAGQPSTMLNGGIRSPSTTS